MQLKELLSKIAELPWESTDGGGVDGDEMAGIFAADGYEIRGADPGDFEPESLEFAMDNWRYAAHAANVLPELVLAAQEWLDAVDDQMGRADKHPDIAKECRDRVLVARGRVRNAVVKAETIKDL